VRLCLAKRETVVVDDLYTMAANGTYNCDGGWNHKRCLAGASGLMFSVATPALGALDVTVSSICRSVYNV
jgi:cytosine/uracil/thiamine/allantoin permease